MKAIYCVLLNVLLFCCVCGAAGRTVVENNYSLKDSLPGASLKDSVEEITLQYRTRNGLIILPVKINDTLKVNLVIDAQCKSVVLFGNRYYKLLEATHHKT